MAICSYRRHGPGIDRLQHPFFEPIPDYHFMIQSIHFSAERKKWRDITEKRQLNAIGEIGLLRSGPAPGTITAWLYTEWLGRVWPEKRKGT